MNTQIVNVPSLTPFRSDLEKEYQTDYYNHFYIVNRLALMTALVIMASFGLLVVPAVIPLFNADDHKLCFIGQRIGYRRNDWLVKFKKRSVQYLLRWHDSSHAGALHFYTHTI